MDNSDIRACWHYHNGTKHPNGFLMSGFERIFQPKAPPDMPKDIEKEALEQILEDLYYQVRCGMVHTGGTKSKVIINKKLPATVAVKYNRTTAKIEEIVINPTRSLLAIEFYLSEYCAELRNVQNQDTRNNFEATWEALKRDL